MSDRISEKTDRRVLYTLIALLVLGLLALAGILFNKYVKPRYWDYRIVQADGAWQKYDLSFHCPQANLLILNGSRSVTRSPHREILSQPSYYQVPETATVTKVDGILQVGGYGTQFKGGPLDTEQFKTFFTADPDHLRCEIVLYRYTWAKEFLLDPRGRTVTVDGIPYDLDGDLNGDKPVVLYVDEDGDVVEIDDFEREFGESLETYVRMPVLLPLPKSLEAQHEENGDATKAFSPPD